MGGVVNTSVGSHNINFEREKPTADVVVVVVNTAGSPFCGIVDLVKEVFKLHTSVSHTLVAETEQNDKKSLFA